MPSFFVMLRLYSSDRLLAFQSVVSILYVVAIFVLMLGYALPMASEGPWNIYSLLVFSMLVGFSFLLYGLSTLNRRVVSPLDLQYLPSEYALKVERRMLEGTQPVRWKTVHAFHDKMLMERRTERKKRLHVKTSILS